MFIQSSRFPDECGVLLIMGLSLRGFLLERSSSLRIHMSVGQSGGMDNVVILLRV